MNAASEWEFWYSHWHKISCGRCNAIIEPATVCPACGQDYRNAQTVRQIALDDGRVMTVHDAFLGADEWPQFVLLQLMFREWTRPLDETTRLSMPESKRPSARLVIVILFWTHFELLMTRLLERAARSLPDRVRHDLLARYTSVGSRMQRLYPILVGTSMKDDFNLIAAEEVYAHLLRVQTARNSFVHGNTEAIDDEIVFAVVEMVPKVDEAWMKLYNKTCRLAYEGDNNAT